jgi:hypothetical protein
VIDAAGPVEEITSRALGALEPYTRLESHPHGALSRAE